MTGTLKRFRLKNRGVRDGNPNPWPRYVQRSELKSGMTDQTLKALVGHSQGFWAAFPKVSPISFWAVETYSFGKTFRKMLKWPWYLPLTFDGDHGVELSENYFKHEEFTKAKTYVTWSRWKKNHPNPEKRTVHSMHPWVYYRRKMRLSISPEASGTLVFISHTLPNSEKLGFNYREYFAGLNDLPKPMHPFTICVQMHDVRKGVATELRNLGLPVVTLGNSSNPNFVDRFYDLLSRYKYATSNVIGSQLFYAQEFGVDYFLFGPEVFESVNQGKGQSYYRAWDEKLVSRVKEEFSWPKIGPSSNKAAILSDALGLDIQMEKFVPMFRKIAEKDLISIFPIIAGRSISNAQSAVSNQISQIIRRKVD